MMSRSIRGRPAGAVSAGAVIATVALLVTLASLAAQPGANAGISERQFKAGVAAEATGERVQAVRAMASSSHPNAFALLEAAYERVWKSRDKHHKKYKALGEKQDAAKPFRRVPSPTQNDKIVSLDRQMQLESGRLKSDERVLAELRKAMGRVHAALPPEKQADATEFLSRRLRGQRKPIDRSRLAAVVGHLKGPGPRALLESQVVSPDPEVRMAALAALGRQKDEAATGVVGAALTDAFWQVRATAVEALVRIGGKGAVEALIIGLAKVDGRIKEDISRALTKLTGQNFHDNPVVWQNWWAKNKADYEPPPEPDPAEKKKRRRDRRDRVAGGRRPSPGEEPRPGEEPDPRARAERPGGQAAVGGTTFYGIQSKSKRLVYILDVSGSMNMALGAESPTQTGVVRPGKLGERKIDQAIIELKKSITALPADATFNIVFYNETVDVWKKGQVAASAKNKKKAIAWAGKVSAIGATNIFDAVERAFGLAGRGTFDKNYVTAADTFFLLSDGRANRGRLVRSPEMLREIFRLNALNKVKVHTISLGADADLHFMSALARRTGGEFVHFGPRGRNRGEGPRARRP